LAPGLGELIVSAERAVHVARQLRRPPAAELALYLVHGLLHLAGYDDGTAMQRRAMRRAESRVLRTIRGAAKLQIRTSKLQKSSKPQDPIRARQTKESWT
ncbi:MAG: rRNA maturation RNase YbeY, partial [Verrucomicrobia bacterium]|nr:rRNA maturation RNase YbeY [Verrucomicrobiota bacterium]